MQCCTSSYDTLTATRLRQAVSYSYSRSQHKLTWQNIAAGTAVAAGRHLENKYTN